MKIGIDVREFKKGVYTGLRTILEDFLTYVGREYEFVFFGNQHTDFDSIPAPGKHVMLNEVCTLWWDQVRLPAALKREKINVFFSPYIKTPLKRVCPYVSTVCDVIPLVVSRYRNLKGMLERMYFRFYVHVCSRRSVKVITLSEDAKNKISSMFGIKKDKLEVAYPSVVVPATSTEYDNKEDLMVKRYGLDKPYLLYVGNFKPHKNINRLISAYCLLPQEARDKFRLMLVGGSEKETGTMYSFLISHGLIGKVIPVENISHDDIWFFLEHASIFVFPSLAEGFGIPPVEAMAVGVPVVSSGILPMTEVLGDAAVFFDPRDSEDISKKILDLVNDKGLREYCVEMGLKRAASFTAERLSEKIMRVIVNAGAGTGR
ncbi:MAG: glycosyltransferase family 1 protein [Candidatus Omnitrophota bacterium]|nr:glycosyltransferase family 1 protein [Candidatus Omnitrophota bacterium]